MKFYLDGYNVIGCTHHISLTETGKEQTFIDWIKQYLTKGDYLVIIFDGKNEFLSFPSKEKLPGITVISTSRSRSADDYIKEDILLKKDPVNTVIVTSDRDIMFHAKKSKFKVMTSANFLSWFCKNENQVLEKSFKPLSDRQLNYWLEEFGDK